MISSAAIFFAVIASTTVMAAPNQLTHSLDARDNQTPAGRTTGYVTLECLGNANVSSEKETYTLANADDGPADYYKGRTRPQFYLLSKSTPETNKEVLVDIDLDAAAKGPVDMIAKGGSPKDPASYVGAFIASEQADVDPKFFEVPFSLLHLAPVNKTSLGRPGVAGSNQPEYYCSTHCGYQSAIWRYNAETKELTPEWVNQRLGRFKLEVSKLPNRRVVLTDSLSAWKYKSAPNAPTCHFKFKALD